MFECILVADTGSGNKDQYSVAESMSQLIKKNPSIKSVMIIGDNIYPSGCHSVDDEQFLTKFQDPYKDIDLPFYLCLGNHDYGTMFSNYSDTQVKYTFSKHNKDHKWNMPKKWYSLKQRFVDFFFIDTNFEWMDEAIIKKQLLDTRNAIKQSHGKWKVLCGHHTWRSIGGHGNAEPKHEKFMDDLLREVNIDLYACGHDHCKSLIEVGKHKIPTLVIGTGGKSYDEDKYTLDKMNMDKSVLKFFSPNLGVCHMKCNNNSMVLTCYNELLEKEYQYKIKK